MASQSVSFCKVWKARAQRLSSHRIPCRKYVPFAPLQCAHGRVDVVVVAGNLLLVSRLAFVQMLEGIVHSIHFLTALDPPAVLAPEVGRNGVKNALVTIGTRYFVELF